MKANEKNFISLIRRKKEEGILYVIETYSGYLRAIVCRRLYALPDRVDECMNDIFLGIWKNIDSFDASRGSFKNWAGGIARLQAIDCLRRASRELSVASLDGLEIPAEDTSLLALIEQELSEETQALLSCLAPKDQELFLRIYAREEEPHQVSWEMGLTVNSLYVRLFRGKKKLRMMAEKEGRCHL